VTVFQVTRWGRCKRAKLRVLVGHLAASRRGHYSRPSQWEPLGLAVVLGHRARHDRPGAFGVVVRVDGRVDGRAWSRYFLRPLRNRVLGGPVGWVV